MIGEGLLPYEWLFSCNNVLFNPVLIPEVVGNGMTTFVMTGVFTRLILSKLRGNIYL
jgi:hypothetical protein